MDLIKAFDKSNRCSVLIVYRCINIHGVSFFWHVGAQIQSFLLTHITRIMLWSILNHGWTYGCVDELYVMLRWMSKSYSRYIEIFLGIAKLAIFISNLLVETLEPKKIIKTRFIDEMRLFPMKISCKHRCALWGDANFCLFIRSTFTNEDIIAHGHIEDKHSRCICVVKIRVRNPRNITLLDCSSVWLS